MSKAFTSSSYSPPRGTYRAPVRAGVGDGPPAAGSRHRSPSERSRISRQPRRHSIVVRLGILGLALVGAAFGSAVGTAVAIEVPPPVPTTAARGAAPPPAAAASSPVAPPPSPATQPSQVSLDLRIGMSGPNVRELQAQLRRRGARLSVDGAFGPATRRAVIALQRRLRIPRTGGADARLLGRLGLRISASHAPAPAVGSTIRPPAGLPGRGRPQLLR